MSSVLGNGKVRKDQTDHYGRVKHPGEGGGATVDDFVDTDSIIVSEDTETEKIRLDVAADIIGKVENSLQTPITTPTSLELVGIDTNKDQARISIGNGLEVLENVLSLIYKDVEDESTPLKIVVCTESEYSSVTDKSNTLFILNG